MGDVQVAGIGVGRCMPIMKRREHMQTTSAMIHPQLRRIGAILRFFVPALTLPGIKAANKGCRLLRGRHSKRLRYEQVFLPRPDGSKLRLCVYSPLENKINVPGLLWMHGGGIALGVPEQDAAFIRRFIEASGCVVVSPDYRLSVNAPYPAALADCYAALLWLKENGGSYDMRPDQIFVGGDSSGGGLAAAVSLYARDCGSVRIAFQMPLYPMLDDRPTASSRDNDAPMWNTKSNALAWKLYLDGLFGTNEVPAYAAPARATDYSGLPPTCTFVGSIEPFHDETCAYIENLRNSGIETRFQVFDGCFHSFDFVAGKTAIAKEADAFLMDGFNYAVGHYFAEQPSGQK
jgi:acetyl esterase/lipase